jgi:platelet-activating factor acetylhydrolase IB subunit beta/gamma
MVGPVRALDYAYGPYNAGAMDPQTTGWPLSADERDYIFEPEHERRPGAEAKQHKPALWPVTPAAGFWGGTAWFDVHAGLVKAVDAARGPIDVLLVGDSITQQWGPTWQKHFPNYTTVNIGIGGDKTQNVLWRLDHGGVEGLVPRACVLLIGNNNMFFTSETGVAAAAEGIKTCLANLREKFPEATIMVVKVFPAHAPGNRFHEDIKKTNAAIDGLNLAADAKVRVLDLTADLVNADGTLRTDLYNADAVHLVPAGYDVYAARLRPLLEAVLGPTGSAAPSTPPAKTAAPTAATSLPHSPTYPYAAYAAGRLDPQPTGWPLTVAELAYVQRPEYDRKPGHEERKHLPAMWPVVPTAGRWGPAELSNAWVNHHGRIIDAVQAAGRDLDILLVGDSITQGWGGSPIDRRPVGDAWQTHFGNYRTVNAGIGGDRTEGVLWRLEHGLVDGISPKVVVLMIGVNNAPLVAANGVPADAVATGISLCVENLRRKCPQARIVVASVIPAFEPGSDVHRGVIAINEALGRLQLSRDAQVRVVDAGAGFTNADGTLNATAYAGDRLHLSEAGYRLLAATLAPVIADAIGQSSTPDGTGGSAARDAEKSSPPPNANGVDKRPT